MRHRASTAVLVIGLALAATWAVYRETLSYGFDYDDYHFLRPYSRAEVAATFTGPWDSSDVMAKFYRPLTIALYAVRFEFFGLNATAHHATSLALFALAATLAAWLVYRWTGRRAAAVMAALVVVCHPAMPYALVAWITNQMHLAQTIVVLAALVWWHVVRTRSLIWWLPLLAFAVASFAIKEDGIMLLPTVAALHVITRWIVEPKLRPLPWAFVGMALVACTALVWLRSVALGELGGYGRPTLHAMGVNFSEGLDRVIRLVPADRPWQSAASAIATLLPLIALLSWRWISAGARVCLAGGFVLAIFFNLPFVFITKAEQMYLVAVGAAIALTGAALAALDLTSRVKPRRVAMAVAAAALLAGLASFAAVTRDITRDFEPFGPIVLAHDDVVRTWGRVPPELRDYLARKREPHASRRLSANPIDEVECVTFGVHGRETSPAGVPYMWMSGARAEIQVRANARSAAIPLRHPIEAFREPTRAVVVADRRLADDLAFTTPDWRTSTIPLRPSDAPRIGRMHRIQIAIDHAWRPSEVIPGSTDERVLALQIGEMTIR